jgi:hypothetical protein
LGRRGKGNGFASYYLDTRLRAFFLSIFGTESMIPTLSWLDDYTIYSVWLVWGGVWLWFLLGSSTLAWRIVPYMRALTLRAMLLLFTIACARNFPSLVEYTAYVTLCHRLPPRRKAVASPSHRLTGEIKSNRCIRPKAFSDSKQLIRKPTLESLPQRDMRAYLRRSCIVPRRHSQSHDLDHHYCFPFRDPKMVVLGI